MILKLYIRFKFNIQTISGQPCITYSQQAQGILLVNQLLDYKKVVLEEC